jgi:hypothetical protein
MGKIIEDAKYLSPKTEEYQQLSHYLSEGNYFSKLNYVLGFMNSKSAELSVTNEFKREIEKILTLIMEIPEMKSDNHESEEKEDLQISICYLLSVIQEDIHPGIIQEM